MGKNRIECRFALHHDGAFKLVGRQVLPKNFSDGLGGIFKCLNNRIQQRIFGFQGRFVDHQAAGNISHMFHSFQTIGLKVFPLETKSTIASLKPTKGASSIEPYSLMMSTCTPLSAKCSAAMSGYWWQSASGCRVWKRRRNQNLFSPQPSCGMRQCANPKVDTGHLRHAQSAHPYRQYQKSAAPYCT